MKTLLHKKQETMPEILPIIPTMDVVVFPLMIVPLLVLDTKIINGINKSLETSKRVLLLAARNQVDQQGAIGTNDLYEVGTIASIMRVIKIPEGGIKILIQGLSRARVTHINAQNETLQATVEEVSLEEGDEIEILAQIKNIKSIAEKIALTQNKFSPDFHIILSKIQDADKVADFVLSHLSLTVEQAQSMLELTTKKSFLQMLYAHLSREIEVAEVQEKIKNSARESMNKSQKEFYLREQLKAIKQELGEDDTRDIEDMRKKLLTISLPETTKQEIIRQIDRLERTAADSLEATVTRNYLEWIFALPWGVSTEENLDIKHAQQILDEDHFGLREIKDRILEFISIRNLKNGGYAPILCFVGPPGTGKTSLGKSIAKSLNRKYSRISLGGVKDESEIRGHRRTYVGSMPGRFIQAMKKAGSCNPVIIVDELDKIGSDFRGDPSAAMLEVLDPQQNKTFYDNYLGVPFDLSQVMFIATANSLSTISDPLRDRMEIIELSGYTIEEKINIAKKHLVNKAIFNAGLEGRNFKVTEPVLKEIIAQYTRESGVRQLERTISKLCSKAARILVEKKILIMVTPKNIDTYLGPRRFLENETTHQNKIGISNGLAWTSYGGEILKIEAALMPGKGKLTLTGQLGDVMKESAQAAISYARMHAKTFGINNNAFTSHDLHIHVPAGATPKDGPSAGITMLTAILSAFTKRPINAQYAMTGELNLRGDIMPIGGVKEKILAAKRNKMQHIILPNKNKNDIIGIEDITRDINIIWVDHADQVIERVLLAHAVKPIKQK